MKHFWTLPVALRVAAAARRPFSVQNDLLAFPQYELVYSDTFISPEDANSLLQKDSSLSSSDVARGLQHEQQVLGDDGQAFEEPETYERMMLHDRPFLCRIPHIAPEMDDNSTSSESQQAEQQQELIRASDSGWKLLQGMEGMCLYQGTGWWWYSFCYGHDVSQFHPLPPTKGQPLFPPTPDPDVHNFKLGVFNKDERKSKESEDETSLETSQTPSPDTDLSTQLQTRGESNFLVQKLSGGSTCDLTGQPRQIEVQYHCNPNNGDRINMVKEVATCQYQIVIHTPRLCNEAAFLPPQTGKPNTIACQEIIGKDEVETWKKGKAAQAQYELFLAEQDKVSLEQGQSRKRPVIGGIELGGQKLVGGSPERTVKASKLARPPKMEGKGEKYIATLASSDGKHTKIMNEREIRKHDLQYDLDQIEDYIVQTEEWAENVRPGQPWKLDVVQTANGMEYRGILMTNNEEEEEEGESKEKGDVEKKQEGSEEEYKQTEKKP